MYRIVVLVLCCKALSLPVTDEASTRNTRELIECCPCPGSRDEVKDQLAGSSQLLRTGSDDCTCMPREADSEGSSSIFFPSAVRADELRPNDPKGDTKNLLEPEVALATSMLDTLREATEEEYQDALARDAARTALQIDAVPEESARNVVYIVNPRVSDNDDGIISEASNAKEFQCIHPLENLNLEHIKPLKPTPLNLADILKIPKLKHPSSHRNVLHTDSNALANTIESNTDGAKNPQYSLQHPILKLTTPIRNFIDNHNVRTLQRSNSSSDVTNKNETSFIERLKFPLLSKLKSYKNVVSDYDFSSVLSNVHNQSQQSVSGDKVSQLFRPPILPLNLRHVMKLKDVELIPKTINRTLSKSRLHSSILSASLPVTNQNKMNLKNMCDKQLKSAKSINDDNENEDNVLIPKLIQPLDQINIEHNLDDENIFKHSDKEDVQQAELDAWSSPSQVHPIIIEPESEMEAESAMPDINETKRILEHNESPTNLKRLVEDIQDELENVNTKPNNSKFLKLEDNYMFNNITLNNDLPSETDNGNIILTIASSKKHENNAINLLSNYEKNQAKDVKACFDSEQDVSQTMEDEITQPPLETIKNIKSLPRQKPISPVSETLSSLRKNFAKKIVNLKNIPLQSEVKRSNNKDNIKNIGIDKKQNNEVQDLNLKDEENIETSSDLNPSDTENSELKNTQHAVSMADLQDMSDKLLNLNLIYENKNKTSELDGDDIYTNDVNLKSNVLKSEIDNESSEAITNSINYNDNLAKHITSKEEEIVCSIDKENRNTQQITEKKSNLGTENRNQKEMDTGASDMIIKTVPGIFGLPNSNLKPHTLLKEITHPLKVTTDFFGETLGRHLNLNKGTSSLVDFEETSSLLDVNDSQPLNDPLTLLRKPLENIFGENTNLPTINNLPERSSFFEDTVSHLKGPLNLLQKPLGDILNLKANLPTFNDNQEQLDNICNPNDKSAEEESSSIEDDDTNESSIDVMAPEASITNFQTKLPHLNNDNHNFNIFNNRPLPTIDQLLKPTRLNSYYTKVPSDIELSSLKTGSKLSKTRTQIGKPSLVFQPGRKLTTHQYEPSLTYALGDGWKALPSLDEIGHAFQSKTGHLLSIPVQPSSMFKSNNVEDIAETIRQNTQKTMKGLKQKMKTKLKESNISKSLGDPFAKPQELFEDFHDKLKGIHCDLNDRLSSIHEDIMDSSKFKSLFDQPRQSTSRNVMTNLRQEKRRKPPTRLQTAASIMTSQEVDPKNTPKDLISDKITRNYIDKVMNKTPKLQSSAESVPTPSRVETFKRTSPTISNLQMISPLRENPSLSKFLSDRKLLSKSITQPIKFEDVKTPIFRRPVNPFKYDHEPNKVTISFGTTTAVPISLAESVPKYRTSTRNLPQLEEQTPKYLSGLNRNAFGRKLAGLNHNLKSNGDTKVSATELKPLQMSSQGASSNEEEFEDIDDYISQEENHVAHLKPPVLKELPIYKTFKIHSDINRSKVSTKFEDSKEITTPVRKSLDNPSMWPKSTENSLLSKMRRVNTRLSNRDQVPDEDEEFEHKFENIKTLSKNSNKAFDETLKENVSYRCRMVCNKEFT